ncbi:MAG TPA: CsgG/HfaB family protein, partial [Verrucomicrobiae bacterium]
MKKSLFVAALTGTLFLPLLASAQEKATMAISSIKATPSLAGSVKPGNQAELGRIIESLDSQLVDRVNATRKFDVVGRSDLAEIIKEQDLGASGNVDAKTAAKAGKLAGAKYLLVATVDDFQDYNETATFATINRTVTKRVFRFSVVAKIYDSSTGKLLESANLQTGNDEFKKIQEEKNYAVKDGELSDEMMVAL